jgi:hypothetical protein
MEREEAGRAGRVRGIEDLQRTLKQDVLRVCEKSSIDLCKLRALLERAELYGFTLEFAAEIELYNEMVSQQALSLHQDTQDVSLERGRVLR